VGWVILLGISTKSHSTCRQKTFLQQSSVGHRAAKIRNRVETRTYSQHLQCSTVLVAILRTDTHRARDQERTYATSASGWNIPPVRLKRVTDKNADCELAAKADWKEQIN
jgi:hypothetical protein